MRAGSYELRGGSNAEQGLLIGVTVLVAAVAVVAVAGAGKIGNGSSTGSALVFVPNPVQSLGDESLTDQKDSDGRFRPRPTTPSR